MKRINRFFFDGLSPWDVTRFFIHGLRKGDLQTRSNSLAFSFFLAFFPSLIFLFTLIPYVPIKDFQLELLILIRSFLPSQAYSAAHETIEDILLNKRGGVLSIGFFSAMFFSTDGIYAMLESFKKSIHSKKKRSGFKQRLIAIFLTGLLTILIIVAIALLVLHQFLIHFIYDHHFLNRSLYVFILDFGKWIIILALAFTAISCLYFFGNISSSRFKFISAGSTLATILIILTSLLFNYVVTNFIHYNKIYGSIGTLIMIMLYIKFNSLQLLIGYEMNASIENAKRRMAIKNKEEPIPID